MTDDAILIRAVPLPRQFAVVGTIHSLAIAAFAGFLVLAPTKLVLDALRPEAGLVPSLAAASAAFAVAFFGAWSLHRRKLIRERERTTYAIHADRVEVRRDGVPEPADVVPLGRTVAVQSWTGPYQRPQGLATLTLVVEERRPDGPPLHVFHPLPNVPEPEAVAAMIQARIDALKA